MGKRRPRWKRTTGIASRKKRKRIQMYCKHSPIWKAHTKLVEGIKQAILNSGTATPDTPKREWACNRCMYSWGGNSGWCPSCGETATHGEAFELMEDL